MRRPLAPFLWTWVMQAAEELVGDSSNLTIGFGSEDQLVAHNSVTQKCYGMVEKEKQQKYG